MYNKYCGCCPWSVISIQNGNDHTTTVIVDEINDIPYDWENNPQHGFIGG